MRRWWMIGIGAGLALALGACEASDTFRECTNAPSISNAQGKLHGEACEADAECMYGRCIQSPAAGYRICTKDCSCGDLAVCNDDDTADREFLCALPVSTSGSAMAQCLIACASAGECQAIDARLDQCGFLPDTTGLSSGARKVCFASGGGS